MSKNLKKNIYNDNKILSPQQPDKDKKSPEILILYVLMYVEMSKVEYHKIASKYVEIIYLYYKVWCLFVCLSVNI